MVVALLLCLGQGIPTEADAKKAEARLAEKPEDPAANLTIGTYLAWAKDDWEGAGPFIERSSDAILKKAFQADAAGGKNGLEMVGVGDEWLSASGKRRDLKGPCRDRAIYWYSQAWPLLDDFGKVKMRARLLAMARSPWNAPSVKNPSIKGWQSAPGVELATTYATDGKWALCMQAPPEDKVRACMWSSRYIAPPGTKCTLSIWFLSDGTDSADDSVMVPIQSADGKLLAQPSLMAMPDLPYWKKMETAFTIPDGAARFYVRVVCDSKQGHLWVDGISIRDESGKELLPNGSFEQR